ncbi:MAG: DUF475 domain-containing protein [Candidatus Pacebacteria bacterium]|nr:DUF475 domain-containing protein [Candidatus Paceibacterota bacterium]
MSSSIQKIFFWPVLISFIAFVLVWVKAGFSAFLLVVILSILEVTLSFDNAVVNAKVLERMSPTWQRRFLTWGIAVAVFGTRFILPILIVSVATWASPWFVTTLAFTNPVAYGHLLEGVHGSITAFGGVFLMMVSLKYFFNKAKDIHWIEVIEKHLVKWGRIEAIEIALALILLTTLSFFTHFEQASVLVAGIIGLVLFVTMEGLAGSLSIESEAVAKSGLALFIYLNILDSAFSLDGVIGAFALTSNLLIIVVGLGIGAYFVRALTLYFVQQKTLTELVYLEHGAHWAILGLAIAMLANLVVHVPEVVTGLVGLCFVALAYRSSLREMAGLK